MSGKFMSVKRVVLPIMAAIILVSQLCGCAAVSSREMVEMVDAGQEIVLEVNRPTAYTVSSQGTQIEDVTWVQLDQLKTFNTGFRQGFDEAFNINIITDANKGTVGGKQGCLYVVNVDGKEMRSGNTTIADAFRNETFVNKYWNNSEVIDKLSELGSEVYSDIQKGSNDSVNAALNAYFNLLNDSSNPESFNPTESVSREEFYTLLFKATNGVRDLGYNASTDEYTKATGGETEYSMYASQVEDLNFVNSGNNGISSTDITQNISRLEAIYMLVLQNFPEQYAAASDTEASFSDAKCVGDLALKAGFKWEVEKERVNAETGKTEKYTEIVEHEQWEKLTLAYMFKNTNKGIQSELYRALVVAKQVGMINDDECRWDEALSKSEAIDLIIDTQLAKNDIFGYATHSEYATIDAPNSYVSTNETEKDAPSTDIKLDVYMQTHVLEYDELTEAEVSLFEIAALDTETSILNDWSVDELLDQQLAFIDTFIRDGLLPENGKELYNQWLIEEGLLDEWRAMESEQTGTPAPVQQPEEVPEEVPEYNVPAYEQPVVNQNKPQPSESQQQQQQDTAHDIDSGDTGSGNGYPTKEEQIETRESMGLGGTGYGRWDNGLWDDVQ